MAEVRGTRPTGGLCNSGCLGGGGQARLPATDERLWEAIWKGGRHSSYSYPRCPSSNCRVVQRWGLAPVQPFGSVCRATASRRDKGHGSLPAMGNPTADSLAITTAMNGRRTRRHRHPLAALRASLQLPYRTGTVAAPSACPLPAGQVLIVCPRICKVSQHASPKIGISHALFDDIPREHRGIV